VCVCACVCVCVCVCYCVYNAAAWKVALRMCCCKEHGTAVVDIAGKGCGVDATIGCSLVEAWSSIYRADVPWFVSLQNV
jgi:hypothetical protein